MKEILDLQSVLKIMPRLMLSRMP